MAELNWIDAALSVVLLASALFGLFRGLIRGVFGIASLIVSFLAARRYGEYVSLSLTPMLGESAFVFALGYALIFVAAMLAFSALTHFIRRAAAHADLGLMDNFGGLLFGALRGGLICALMVVALSLLPLQGTAAWGGSVMLPLFGRAISLVVSADAFAGYGQYWRFDEKHRPRLSIIALANSAAANATARPANDSLPSDNSAAADETAARDRPSDKSLSQLEEAVQQRDDMLDDINDEIAAQSNVYNQSSKQNALRNVKRQRRDSFLQDARDLLRQAVCDENGECAVGDE